MEIALDREKRLTLLRWLKRGAIDRRELSDLATEADKSMTAEELESELDRLTMLQGGEECQRLQRLGFCKYGKPMTQAEAREFLRKLEEEY